MNTWQKLGGLPLALFAFLCLLLIPFKSFSDEAAGKEKTYNYEVKKGDTLWDICKDKYNDPLVWPKLWEINPQIENPHWIYPGDEIKIYYEKPGTGEAEKRPFPKLVLNYPISSEINFVSTPEEEGSFGTIVAGRIEQKVMLSEGDPVYVEFPEGADVKIGGLYQTFSVLESFDHPVTGERFGNLNKVTGIVKIKEKADTCYIAEVVKSYSEIGVGSKLRPLPIRISKLTLVPGKRHLTGYIVYSETPLISDHVTVFIDLGKKQGVQVGNYFDIYKEDIIPEREIIGRTRVFPPYKIGELIVLDVQQNSSTCLVLKSLKEIVPGEFVKLLTSDDLYHIFSNVVGSGM